MTEKQHTGFAGIEPEAIDHKNPPKPLDPVQSEKRKPDHFTYERPEAIDIHNPPQPKKAE